MSDNKPKSAPLAYQNDPSLIVPMDAFCASWPNTANRSPASAGNRFRTRSSFSAPPVFTAAAKRNPAGETGRSQQSSFGRRAGRGTQARHRLGRHVPLLRRRAAHGTSADRMVRPDSRQAPSFRGHHRRRTRHYGSRQPGSPGSRRKNRGPQHQPALRAKSRIPISRHHSTSSSTTSSCVSSGSPIWPRRW